MLDVFIRKSLATRTLRQPDISPSTSTFRLELALRSTLHIRWSFLWAWSTCEVWDGGFRSGRAFGIAAVEDMVELGDGVAAFDADWHTALETFIT